MVRKKIIILGAFAVGKTSLLNRFVLDEFTSNYKPTIGVNIKSKSILVDHNEMEFVIWDIADVVTHKNIPLTYLKGTHAAILVFDVAREESYRRIKEDFDGMKGGVNAIEIIVVGNKTDLVNANDLDELKTQLNFKVDFFTSVLKNDNVTEIFNVIGQRLIS